MSQETFGNINLDELEAHEAIRISLKRDGYRLYGDLEHSRQVTKAWHESQTEQMSEKDPTKDTSS